ncbi:fructokinase [Orbus hercynius]|uniref:Fructokinase n=1 Tax=Orbus hercynius TaxID=593135 RepID=A0A495RJL5_9GAMM|nr:aminoimidazole riboside kinase [Orbus hercynius]RKS87635.1 fructokinase [Orbus hercynius]
MQKTKIWCLGDAVVDLLPLDNKQYQACAGGAPANVAVGIAKLGNPAGFIGRVGDDPFGHFMQETFASYQVDSQSLEFDPKIKTSTVLVDLAKNGERSFTFLVSPSADQFVSVDALPSFGQDILHFCSLALVGQTCRETLAHAIKTLKSQQGKISFDINLREQMWADKHEMRQVITRFVHQADILKLSDEELFWLTESDDWENALDKLEKDYSATLKIITKGSEGSIVLWNQARYQYSAYKVTSIDTTGAGDAFVAGLLSGIAIYDFPTDIAIVDTIISIASACGALATTEKGALTALPTNHYLQEFISENKTLDSKKMK